MQDKNRHNSWSKGVTLVEMVVAISMMTVVLSAILPLLASIRNSWDTRQADAEALQNGRVLTDHIQRHLATASVITDVSLASDETGYIEFTDADGISRRYQIGPNGYVQYGAVGDLADLAGPVSKLQFTCHSLEAPDVSTTDTESIRLVDLSVTFTSTGQLSSDKTMASSVYLRTGNGVDQVWMDQDIGSVAATGSAVQVSGNSWSIDASGNDIWNSSDEFHYVYRTLTGNGQIIAKVESLELTNSWAKSGVMIRETLNANSKYAFMALAAENGSCFQWRSSTGSSAQHTAGNTSARAPIWVKLTRSGNTFTGYASTNGVNWSLIDSNYITMNSEVYIGLAVTSHNDGIVCTSELDNVYFSSTITTGYALIPETMNPPTIDGNIDDVWTGAPTYSVDNLISGSLYSDEDLAGTWKALWDASHIYYLFEITDNYLKRDSTSFWDDDTVELLIDADNSRNYNFDYVNDFHIGFRWNDSSVRLGPYSVNNSAGITFDIDQVTGGYRVEISIPWSTLNVTPSINHLIGLDVLLTDDDSGGGSMDAAKTWYITNFDYWDNPNRWGTAQLTEHDIGTDDPQVLP